LYDDHNLRYIDPEIYVQFMKALSWIGYFFSWSVILEVWFWLIIINHWNFEGSFFFILMIAVLTDFSFVCSSSWSKVFFSFCIFFSIFHFSGRGTGFMLLKIKKNVDVSFQTRILEILDYCCVSGKMVQEITQHKRICFFTSFI